MSKKKTGLISLGIITFIIVIISIPSSSNMNNIKQIEEHVESLKMSPKCDSKSVIVMITPSISEECCQQVFSEIIEYDINTASKIPGKDDISYL